MRTKLRPDEKVLFLTRKHWIFYSKVAVFFVIVVVLMVLAWKYNFEFARTVLFPAILMFVLYAVYCYYDRKFNIWAVTNQRYIDEWGVLSRNSRETPLEKINNISYRQDLLGMLLDYGTVEVQSAAEQGLTVSQYVSEPKKLVESVNSAILAIKADAGKSGVKRCPWCAEEIKAEAKICRFCGREQESGQ